MTEHILNRRAVLARALALASLWGLPPAAARAADVCTPDYAGDKTQRDSLHYAEATPDTTKTCESCQYFEGRGRCGICRILNCPVNPSGTCDSWSKKFD